MIFEQPVADRDRPAGENVCPEAAAVDEILDDAGPGETLQVPARLADLHAEALDVAETKALADQVVNPDAAHHDLPAGLRPAEADVLEYLGLDQGQRLSRPGPIGAK